MQSLKSRIILGLLIHSHYFKFKRKKPPFDSSLQGIIKYREKTENAAAMFGKLPEGIVIKPSPVSESIYAEWITMPDNPPNKAILWFHGGFYMIGSAQSHRQHVAKFVKGSKVNALVFNYRRAPEHPFPAGFEDAIRAFYHLSETGFRPEDIVFAGDSAGGGLCLATLLALKNEGSTLPGAMVLLSPWTDLMLTGSSYQHNKHRCFAPDGCAVSASELYADGQDKSNLYISPLYGDLKGLPPMHISAGSNETLLDDSLLFAEKARKAGVQVKLVVGEGMCHCYPVFGNLFRESKETLAEICEFINKHTG